MTTATPPRQTWHTLGLELSFYELGPAEGTPLLLLHGLLDTAGAHVRLATHLAEGGFRVVVPDQRGHGESGHVGDGGYYHFADYVLDLDGLFRHLGIEQAVLAGHSMGAAVATYFAGSFPERALALVMLDAIGPPRAHGVDTAPARWRRWVEDVRRREDYRESGAPSLDAMASRIGRLSTRAPRDHLLELARAAATQREDDGRWVWKFDPLHRTSAPYAFDAQRFEAFLEAIPCPALMLWAQSTILKTPEAVARLSALRDVTERTLPDVGHNLHHERPDAVADAVLEFLEARGL